MTKAFRTDHPFQIGTVATQLGCGLLILGVGIAGYFTFRRIEYRQRRGGADSLPTPGD